MSLFGAQFDPEGSEYDSTAWDELLDFLEPESSSLPEQSDTLNIFNVTSQTTTPLIPKYYSLETQLSSNISMAPDNTPTTKSDPKTKDSVKRKEEKKAAEHTHAILKSEPMRKRQKLSDPTLDPYIDSVEAIQVQIECLHKDIEQNNQDCEQELKQAQNAKERRLLRNRFSASTSRITSKIRKLEAEKLILELKNKISQLEEENVTLTQRNLYLQEENVYLKTREQHTQTLQFSSHTALNLPQELLSGQQVTITTRHELQASPNKRNGYKS
ncbi:hypothetical protein CC99x_004880 [Candidatus Berkiella cookevillensis]|uniref:Uncharacterized protein n=1 Tax=Candidatus Berkiella cookevillensis TaxID=437022 RepID=A0A0Q9YTL5_9GAMM|nr:hypothetical protein [Candidatus Berkiella cookevillensis]MCS5708233.1 hypothetical protein [Candidatus Berkiella cookevillensis]